MVPWTSRDNAGYGGRLGGSGSALFSDADDYRANLPLTTRLLALQPGMFQARVTWLELADLHVLHARETGPRIAYVSLPSERVFFIFPTHRSTALICDSIPLRLGDIVFHGQGERFHQRTDAATAWSFIALKLTSLQAYGKTLLGQEIVPPPFGRILHPCPAKRRQLLRLHAEAVRVVETQLNHIGNSEVVRAVEQDLIWALTTCLADASLSDESVGRRQHAQLMVQFADVLTAIPDRPLRIPDVCGALGVSEHTLETCCLEVLGMDPARYLHLCYLQRVHHALLRADAAADSEAGVMKCYGFADPKAFTAAYRDAFGVFPRLSARQAPNHRM
jgi:AraC-like DNA-binding protein